MENVKDDAAALRAAYRDAVERRDIEEIERLDAVAAAAPRPPSRLRPGRRTA